MVGGFLGFGSVEDSKAYSSASKAASVFGSLLGLLIAITGVAKLRNQCERLVLTFWVTPLSNDTAVLRNAAYYRVVRVAGCLFKAASVRLPQSP